MQIVLLSGGSGKRLWPLSNDIRSKQFLRLFRSPDGEYESMLQRMYRHIRGVDPEAGVTIAAGEAQVPGIMEQLGDDNVGISIEPCRRDTFPAIALTSAYLHDRRGVPEDEVVVVCPVDPYVDERYFEALRALADIAASDGASNLVLMGMEPDSPSEKYGYIIPETGEHVSKVSMFKEKPSAALAAQYIEQGALWNGGVFAYRLGYVLNRAHELMDFDSYDDLFAKYSTLRKISFDYAVVEHEPDISVMRFKGRWMDIGTWDSLTDAIADADVADGRAPVKCGNAPGEEIAAGEDAVAEGAAAANAGGGASVLIGKAMLGDACENVSVINELGIPVLCMGLEDVIVTASKDGILVTSRKCSGGIKPYVERLEAGE